MIDFYVKYLLPTNVYGIHIRVHEFAGMDHFVMCLCVCWTMLIRRILFSLKWDSSKCCRENIRRVMTWVTSSSSQFYLTNDYHTSMWYILMFMTWQFLFSSQYLSHPVASSDAHMHISHQVMPLLFFPKFPSPQCIRHGSPSSPTRPSSPFWTNSSDSTWIGTGTRNHLPNRWPEWLHWWQSSTTSLTAPRPSPTTSPCSHHSSQVEAHDTDDPISKVLSQPFSTDQQHPDRQLGLQISPTSIAFYRSVAYPRPERAAMAIPMLNPSWQKGWVRCFGSVNSDAHSMMIACPQQVGIRT